MKLDDPVTPAFASWDSYSKFARRVRFSSRYILGEEDRTFLQTVLATNRDRDVSLKKGMILYRAQRGVDMVDRTDDDGNWIGEDTWGYGAQRMKPLADRAREGRANPTGIPVLYVGSTIETAVSEVRPWVGAELSVAWCRLLRPLRTLDLSRGHGKSSFAGPIFRHVMGGTDPTPEEVEQAVWTDIDNAFSQPVTHADDRADYAPTQILAELFRSAGYDAIGYKSHFGDTEDRGGFNIAIFDPDAVEIASCAPFRVRSINVVAEQFDNGWARSSGGQ
ncbi:RES family NAD+ phosphorylase [Sphingobium sp. HBC34]|uniref:RES family NAD+ phosphorylase n=1 Tax=Sphingobium cyanobacteriorum TaxID=3063954 RepID=A0ABT8ZP50_9SPHN|nr:RES family NAD+ phosphorylase [Sphingobium sp. HBC34]MDO7836307.1 RES family NAD+ phosphorylase [Sphingobium sp. HBC34]